MNADVYPIAQKVILSPESLGNLAVVKAPAPWQLTGDGYIVTFWLPEHMDTAQTFTPDTLKGRHSGRLATIMYVNYHTSDVGPYQELLFIPGQFSFKGKKRWSITKIYVNTWESVVNGNINWGIPKEQADFHVEELNGVHTVQLSQDGHLFAELKFKEMGFKMPVNSRLTPEFMRTLGQHREGNTYLYTPSTKGHVKLGALLSSKFDPHYFPDLTQASVLGAVRVSDFEMVFPVSTIMEGTD